MDRKTSERGIIFGLIVLLAVEVSLLGMHLRWGGFRRTADAHSASRAGRVVKSENELRRRGSGSLVWEKSSDDDAVYYYDSILTLAQSTASLQLDQDTEVHLSENTLVTIEPQDKKGGGEIRLKFVRGNLSARNPFAAAHVESETWAMEIKTGSEIEFRQTGDGRFELGVKKGSVDFTTGAGRETVAPAEVLRLDGERAEKLRVDEGWTWTEVPPARVYTHGEAAAVNLHWRASGATELVLQSLGKPEATMALAAGENSRRLELPAGQHKISLRGQGKSSAALTVDVWRAPVLHLVSPLPRNRVRTNEETAFLWTETPGVASYDFILQDGRGTTRENLKENLHRMKFEAEDDLQWSVEGRDADGFGIPALYSYPLYIREAPLAAPKLRSPLLRRPAKADDRGASYRVWDWIFPAAAAEDLQQYQAVFSWDKVEGADRYVIEISERADFRKPLVNKTVTSNEFTWMKMELKTYYWRVAAETKSGRLGIFSEPETADLKKSGQSGVVVTPIEPRPVVVEPPAKEKIEVPPAPQEPAPVKRFEAAKKPEPPRAEPEKFTAKPDAFVEWSPGFTTRQWKAPENVDATLSGLRLTSVTLGADRPWSGERMVRLKMNYSRFRFKPNPKERYPAQADLSWAEISGQAVAHLKDEHWGYGVYVERSVEVERKDLDSVQLKPTTSLGAMLENFNSWGRIRYFGDYVLIAGASSGILIKQELRVPLILDGFYFGGGLEGGIRLKSSSKYTSFTGQLSLGLEF